MPKNDAAKHASMVVNSLVATICEAVGKKVAEVVGPLDAELARLRDVEKKFNRIQAVLGPTELPKEEKQEAKPKPHIKPVHWMHKPENAEKVRLWNERRLKTRAEKAQKK